MTPVTSVLVGRVASKEKGASLAALLHIATDEIFSLIDSQIPGFSKNFDTMLRLTSIPKSRSKKHS
jgi:hypothetical protein